MAIFLAVVFVACLVVLAFCFLMLGRNEIVYHYRTTLLGEVSRAARRDIEAIDGPRDFMWRYDVYSSVKYEDMVKKFWKPLDSFYPDKSFIE